MHRNPRRTVRVVLLTLVGALLLAWLREGASREAAALEPEEPAAQRAQRELPAAELARVVHAAPRETVRPPAEPAPPEAPAGVPDVPPEEEWEEAPADPPERGPCTLQLELVDARSGAFVASEVLLWRLDAPANEAWTAGDQLQLRAPVPAGGALLRGLPEGRYRARCTAEVYGAPDPPAFAVAGERTRVRLELVLPLERRCFVRAFDERGVELRRAQVRLAGTISGSRVVEQPGWLHGRESLDQLVTFSDQEFSSMSSESEWLEREAGAEGFELGKLAEDSRGTLTCRAVELLAPNGGRARFDVYSEPGACTRFVTVAVDPRAVVPSFFLPDGRSIEAAEGRVVTVAEALPAGGGDPLELWRAVPVTAVVQGDERHEGLALRFRATDLPLAEHVLEPRE